MKPNPRRVAFDVLREVTKDGAYANLALAKRLGTAGLDARDAAFVTELVAGTCRLLGTYDAIIESASGRRLSKLQPAVIDLLRLGAHQGLSMNIPRHATVGTTVDLARQTVGQRVTGLINAVLRKMVAKTLGEWTSQLSDGLPELQATAIKGHHPAWIAEVFSRLLPEGELLPALEANNVAPVPTLVVRPGLADRDELVEAGGVATQFSPWGASFDGPPGTVPAVRQRRAGVQDEGSQLVAWALATAPAPPGPWLDLCAGPGGKAALLTGLARQQGAHLVANEISPHRAELVSKALAGYPAGSATVVCSDGTGPEQLQNLGPFSRIMVDAPCTGLGALRRRPEARWRRTPADLEELVALQRRLLANAIRLAAPGGVVAYVTCSPHPAETREVVQDILNQEADVEPLHAADFLPAQLGAADGDFVQLWPHRHGTDAMFLSLLRV